MMLALLRNWLFGGATENLPERVREAIRQQQDRSEIIIGWAELVLVGLLAIAYETTTMASGVVQEDYSFDTQVFIIYGVFALIRLVLAYRRLLPEWLLYVSILADTALLMGLIYFIHYKYAQPAVSYLKAPALLYVFLLIALRALRFEARFVIVTGLAAAAGWIALILYALSGRGGPPNITDDFVDYLTSNAFLIQAEAEKILAILADHHRAGDRHRARPRSAGALGQRGGGGARPVALLRPGRRRPHPRRRDIDQGG